MSGFSFTRVVVIESLFPSDFKSGTSLSESLIGFGEHIKQVPPVDLFSVKSAGEFCELIDMLTKEANEKGEQHILHIETHGLDDRSGIVFEDKSYILWGDLGPILAPLNLATRFNLLVCVAACFGGHFVEEVRPNTPAPCYAIIGPTHITFGTELLNRFRDFYRQLFMTLDGTIAAKALLQTQLCEGGFLVELSEDWFRKLVVGYIETKCSKEVMEQRASALHARVLSEGKNISIEKVKEIGRARNAVLLDDFFHKFFMTAEVPENIERYSNLLSEARLRIYNFLETQGV